ncbi:MAG: 3-methyladenine DNA glycosylase, partial [Chloroflexota bacterium]
MTIIHLPTPASFSFPATVESHGWYQLAPFRYADGTLHYTYRTANGQVFPLAISEGVQIKTDADLSENEQAEITDAVQCMMGIQTDLTAFYDLTRDIPRLCHVEQSGAGRLLMAPTIWENMVKTLLTTNVSWTNTINMVRRLCDYGDPAADGTHAFPAPQQIAALRPDHVNAHIRAGYRMKSLHQLAVAITDGQLNVESWYGSPLPAEDLYREIMNLHGFGAYAAGSMMRLLGYHQWLALDSVAREAYATLHNNGQKATD